MIQQVTYVNANVGCEDYYDEELINLISKSGNKVLKYFAEPYIRKDKWGYEHTFIYPFLGDIILNLVDQKSKYAEPMLRSVIEYNQYVFDKLQSMVNEAAQVEIDRYEGWDFKPEAEVFVKNALIYFRPNRDEGCFSFLYPKDKKETPKYTANVVRTEAKSDDMLIESLITQLNGLYEAVFNIKPTNV